MAITADAVRQSRQLTAIIYEAFRRSVFVNVGNRRWESQMSGASKLEFLSLGDEGTVQDRTSAQLQAAVTYTTSAATKQTMTRKWFNAFDQLGMEDMRTLAIGGRLESYMAGRLGKKVAIHIDDKIGAIVAGLTYGLVSASGNKNSIVAGSGTDNIARAFPSHPSTAKAITDLIAAIKDAHMLLKEKEAIDGEFEGDAYGSALALVCPVPIARVLVDYLESKGALQVRGDIAGQALVNRGILGTTAYQGSAFGFLDIVGTNALPRPTGTNDWDSYVIPTDGNLVVAVTPTELDIAEFGQGNTAGAYVHRRTIVGSYAALAVKPEHIIRVRMDAG